MIWAVVLAAGESRRMGQAKLLLPFGEATIIETVLRTVVSSRADRALVVLGGYREDIEPKVRNFAVKRVVNENYREGMLSSVQSGLAALPGSARAAVFVLADQPGVPVRVIDSLIDAYNRVKKGIVLPVCREKRGHPLLIDLKYRREIEALPPDLGLRGLLREHPDDILEVPAPDLAVLVDIDTPDEYGRALEGTRRPRSRVRRV